MTRAESTRSAYTVRRACSQIAHLPGQEVPNALQERDQALVRFDQDVQFLVQVVVRLLRDLVEVDEQGRLRGRSGREDEPRKEDGVVRDVGTAQVQNPCEFEKASRVLASAPSLLAHED